MKIDAAVGSPVVHEFVYGLACMLNAWSRFVSHVITPLSLSADVMTVLLFSELELLHIWHLSCLLFPTADVQAFHAFTPEQRATILRHCASIVHAPIDTLERIGGGGVRCTLGEIF